MSKTLEEMNYSFEHDLGIDRHYCKRVVPLEVLSLGMSRTGTMSMKTALHILGYNDVYHGSNINSNVGDADMWVEALRAKYLGKGKPFGRAEFDKLLGHCAAVTDGPVNCFGPELVEAYPEAKVILCEREFEAWLKSFNILITGSWDKVFMFLAWADPWWMGRIYAFIANWLPLQFNAQSAQECREKARAVYKEHYAEIRRVTPNDRLLNYKLGQGWQPLCKFLGKDIPDVPFPHINESIMLKTHVANLAKKGLKRSARNVGTVLAIGALLYWAATYIMVKK